MIKIFLVCCALFFIYPSESYGADDSLWRKLDLTNTVLLSLPQGKVVIELAPSFAPKHVTQFSQLIKQDFYNSTKFYRVIDGFVAQAGPQDGSDKDKSVDTLAIEAEKSITKEWLFTSVQDKDLFAEKTGFKNSFAMATNTLEGKAWLTHCPGVIAMARGNEADSATSHFYFVIGQAPRYLDRIMTVFGRVVYGMQHIQAIQRTAVIAGDNAIDPQDFTTIISMQLMSEVAKAEQLLIEVENTNSSVFIERLNKRRAREGAFFYKKPPPILDVCQIPLRSRRVKIK